MQLRVAAAGDLLPLACRAAVLPLESCRRTYRWGPGAEPTAEPTAVHLPCRRATAEPAVPLPAVPGAGLFCEAYGAGFADYGYLYLARVNHLVLNLLCYICRELLGLFV